MERYIRGGILICVVRICFLLSLSLLVMYLAALPEAAATDGRAVVTDALLLDDVVTLLLATTGTAGDKGDDEGDEEEDQASEGSPGSGSPHGPVVGLGVVDLIANVGKDDEVADNNDDRDDEGQESGQHGKDAAEEARDEREDEADEG